MRPLAWRTAPQKLTIPVGESRSFTATLTAAVDAEYTVATADAKVAVSSEVLGPGVFRGTLIGLSPSESEVTLTAEAAAGWRASRTKRRDGDRTDARRRS